MVFVLGGLEFRIDSQTEGPCAVVQAAGELDLAASQRLRLVIDEALASVAPPRLILDLSEITFCDSHGLDLLISTYLRCTDARGRLVLVVAPGVLSRLLQIANLDRHFEIRPTLAEAVACFRPAA